MLCVVNTEAINFDLLYFYNIPRTAHGPANKPLGRILKSI